MAVQCLTLELSVEILNLGSEISLLLLAGLDSTLAVKDKTWVVKDIEDLFCKCTRQARAATSKAEFIDRCESFADVSTYITAPDCLEIASSSWDDTQACACEWTVPMSDLHPTNTMGVEGEVEVKVGTQCFMALYREEREEMEKQRKKASAEMHLSLCAMVICWSPFLSLLYLNTESAAVSVFKNSKLSSFTSDIMDF